MPTMLTTIQAQYGQFVSRCLRQLGTRRSDLDDLQQEVFVAVHHTLGKFDPQRSMPAWLFGICRNVFWNHYKKAHRRREVLVADLPDWTSEGWASNPEEFLAVKDAYLHVLELLGELAPEKRDVFEMFVIAEMSCSEIATELGLPLGTVHSRLSASRAAVTRALARRKTCGA